MKNNIHILGAIIAVFLIGISITTHLMSTRPPEVSEKIEAEGYTETSRIDSNKTLIYDKDGKIFGYTKKSQPGGRKTIVFDANDNMKGYLEQDLLDSRKLRFFKVSDF